MQKTPHTASLAYRALLLARLVRLGAPESVVANEIAFVVQAGCREYGDTMRKRLARLGVSAPSSSNFMAGMNLNPDDFTKKGKRVLSALDELEASKLSGSRSRIVHWAAILMLAASDLAANYLGEEAQALLFEEDEQ